MKIDPIELCKRYIQSYEKVLEAYRNGTELPDFHWNHLIDIASKRGISKEIRDRAQKVLSEQNDLEWTIGREVYPELNSLEQKVSKKCDVPWLVFAHASRQGFITEEQDNNYFNQMEKLKREKYVDSFIKLFIEIIDIEKAYLAHLESKEKSFK